MTDTTDLDETTWCVDGDVLAVLGSLVARRTLPDWIKLGTYRAMAHAELVELLDGTYPDGQPTFTGPGLESLRWAEAKLAASEVLEAVRANLSDVDDKPARMRASALATVTGGVIGYPPGTSDPDDQGQARPTSRGPLVSSFTPLSLFADPYADARHLGERL